MVLTLYNQIEHTLHFWQTWDDEAEVIVVHGIVGEEGEYEVFDLSSKVRKDINNKIKQLGYQPIDMEEHATLIVEYKITGNFGTSIDNKIQQLEQNGCQPEYIDGYIADVIGDGLIGSHSISEDLEKIYKLKSLLGDLLGDTGLGLCDGASIGNGTMETCCYVVDFDIARKIIEKGLKGTEFENYHRIYNEDIE